MAALSSVLDKDRKAREEGKGLGNLLSDSDLKIAKAEAKDLWNALNSRDVTGNIRKTTMDADAGMKASIKKNFDTVAKTPAVKDLIGTEFQSVKYKGRQPVSQPTRLRGFPKTLGKDIVDPLGFHETLEPPQTSGGVCPPESCA